MDSFPPNHEEDQSCYWGLVESKSHALFHKHQQCTKLCSSSKHWALYTRPEVCTHRDAAVLSPHQRQLSPHRIKYWVSVFTFTPGSSGGLSGQVNHTAKKEMSYSASIERKLIRQNGFDSTTFILHATLTVVIKSQVHPCPQETFPFLATVVYIPAQPWNKCKIKHYL